MEPINYFQILILLLQCVLVSALILSLFRIRSILGISLLYAALGLFQYMQVFLASTVYIEIAKGIFVSPGSSVLFTGSLFAVLLVYIKEDAVEIRKIIYALLITNVIMSVVLYSFGFNFDKSTIYNPFHVSPRLFDNNAWVLFVGTVTLFFDSILIILLYELISKFVSNLFLRIYLTMTLVLSFDTAFFSVCAFWNYNNLNTIVISGFISKNAAVIVYSLLFFIYLKFMEKDIFQAVQPTVKDVFYSLSYRQKFEIAKKEKESEQKKAEKAIRLSEIKYQTLANNSPVGIFLTDAVGYTLYVNPRWCSISGLTGEEAVGNGWLKAVHPEDREKLKSGWYSAAAKKETSDAEYRFLRSNGSVVWVLGQAVPELDPENKIIGYVGTITDITAIKNYEKELNIAKEKAEESNRLKTSFLNNMSHEIRTPMNAIIGFTGFLGNPELSIEKRNFYITIITESTQQLLFIITDILTISSLETKQEALNIGEVNIKDIIRELYSEFNTKAFEKNISLYAKQILSNENIKIYTDKSKVTQILTNLLSNAIKYTHAGFVEFGYNLYEECIEFFVKDTGIGIKQESLEKIFEPFQQADFSIAQQYGGTGLGLAISKGFAELLGGNIRVLSETGKGSVFYLTIPIFEKIEEN
jgi:PAS domain S-box-containing protein